MKTTHDTHHEYRYHHGDSCCYSPAKTIAIIINHGRLLITHDSLRIHSALSIHDSELLFLKQIIPEISPDEVTEVLPLGFNVKRFL